MICNTLDSSGDSTRPSRSPSMTSNDSECSPSSVRTQARMPLWNWRMTVSILAGTPKPVNTCHSSCRSTESHAFSKSMKHIYKGHAGGCFSLVQVLAIDARQTACRGAFIFIAEIVQQLLPSCGLASNCSYTRYLIPGTWGQISSTVVLIGTFCKSVFPKKKTLRCRIRTHDLHPSYLRGGQASYLHHKQGNFASSSSAWDRISLVCSDSRR